MEESYVPYLTFPTHLLTTHHLLPRDAVNDMALHFLSKLKILVVRDIEREDIEFITKVTPWGGDGVRGPAKSNYSLNCVCVLFVRVDCWLQTHC